MGSERDTLIDLIDDSLQQITDLFLRQCAHGAQTKSLPSEFAACGQFIGEGASRIVQRGFHGIAAALRVLGPSQSEDCRHIVIRLVSYCEACFQVHPTLTVASDHRIQDIDNVIKLGELLYGLSFVSPSQADVARLVRHIADQLQNSLVDDRGWGYFLNDNEPHLLPTAYATRGLAQNNFNVAKPRKFMTGILRARAHPSIESPADLTTAVACAYCLTFVRGNSCENAERKAVIDTFDAAWRSLEPLLGEEVEQNLEYWSVKADKTHYVRVPWQLYLLALAAEYRFWRFAAFRAQRRLKAVIKELSSGSFRYPYSGRNLSSRTNAIAYDALNAIRGRIKRLTAIWIVYEIDRLRMLIGSRFIRLIAATLAFLLMVYSIVQWIATGTALELAPSLIASVVVLLLAAGRR